MFGLFARRQITSAAFDAQNLQLEDAPQQFIETSIRMEISSIIDDILQPYIFEKNGLDNVYAVEDKIFKGCSLSLKDILLHAFLGQRQTISQVRFKNTLAEVILLVGKELEDDGTIEFQKFGKVKPIASVIFEEIMPSTSIKLLGHCFSLLWNIYQQTERRDELDKKVIFKMHGFHALFTEPKNAEESYIAAENRRLIKENVQSILSGAGGVIDAEDNIGLFGENSVDHAGFLKKIDMIYAEIARLLKVPLTRLIGRSPDGMNATGESDNHNYNITLERYRSGWLVPFLEQMDIKYQKIEDEVDLDYLQKLMELGALAEMEISEKMKEKIVQLMEAI